MRVMARSSHAACHSFFTVRRVGIVAARRSAALRFTRTARTRSRSNGSPALRGVPFDEESFARITRNLREGRRAEGQVIGVRLQLRSIGLSRRVVLPQLESDP